MANYSEVSSERKTDFEGGNSVPLVESLCPVVFPRELEVFAVSRAATGEVQQGVSETVVHNRSRYADTLHRLDPNSDETRPACPTWVSEKRTQQSQRPPTWATTRDMGVQSAWERVAMNDESAAALNSQ